MSPSNLGALDLSSISVFARLVSFNLGQQLLHCFKFIVEDPVYAIPEA